MRRLLTAFASLILASASFAASPYFLDRSGVLWKGTSTPEGLQLTGEVDGQVQISTIVPFVVGINGNVDEHIQVAADELTGKVTVVWQRTYGEGYSEIYMAVWAGGSWERIISLTDDFAENPRFPLITLSQIHTNVASPDQPEAPGSTVTVRDSFVHVLWWQGHAETQHAGYALLRLTDGPEDPDALTTRSLDGLIPVGLGCFNDVPDEVLEHPLFAAGQDRERAMILFGSKKVCLFHLAEVSFELEPALDAEEAPPSVHVQRRRHIPIFGVHQLYQTPEAFNMDGARLVLGKDLRPVAYKVVDGSIEYVVATGQTWSAVRKLEVRDGLTLDKAIPLIENLAR